jgi:hypothetical protein
MLPPGPQSIALAAAADLRFKMQQERDLWRNSQNALYAHVGAATAYVDSVKELGAKHDKLVALAENHSLRSLYKDFAGSFDQLESDVSTMQKAYDDFRTSQSTNSKSKG